MIERIKSGYKGYLIIMRTSDGSFKNKIQILIINAPELTNPSI